MTGSALAEIRIGFFVTILAEGVGGILEGADLFGHAGLTVMAGLTFLDFLASDIINTFAIRSLGVVTDLALHSSLVGGMGELGRFRGGGRVDGGLQGDFSRSLVGGNSHSGH